MASCSVTGRGLFIPLQELERWYFLPLFGIHTGPEAGGVGVSVPPGSYPEPPGLEPGPPGLEPDPPGCWLLSVFGLVTLILQVAFVPDFIFRVMVATPACFPVTFPCVFTVATFLLLDVHFFTLSPYVFDLILRVYCLPLFMVTDFLFKETFAFNLGMDFFCVLPHLEQVCFFVPFERAVALLAVTHFFQECFWDLGSVFVSLPWHMIHVLVAVPVCIQVALWIVFHFPQV